VLPRAELAAEAPKRKLSSRPGAADSKGFGDAMGKLKEAAGKGAEILDKISSKLKRRGGDRTPRAPRAPRAPPPPRRRSDAAAASGGQPERLSAKEQAVVEGLDAMLQERFQGDWCAAWPSHRCSTHIHPRSGPMPCPKPPCPCRLVRADTVSSPVLLRWLAGSWPSGTTTATATASWITRRSSRL